MSIVRTAYAFTPTSITGCALWLDGADSSTITMVTGVSQWNDKSGNGYNLTQGSTGSQPTRTGNLLNFVTNYNMNIPQAAINNASTWSMFFAVNPIASVNWFMAKQRDGVNSYNIFSTTQTGGPGPNAYFTGLTNYLYVRMFNAGTLAASSAALTMSQLQILSFVYDGTNMLIYINGNLSSTTAGSFAIQNDTSSTNFLLGQWFGNGTNYNSNGNFQLGELIYFNSSLTATQRQQVEGYLAQKWGLTASLPLVHPGRTLRIYRSDYLVPNRLKPTPYYTQFSPRQIAGCQLWLDAADPAGNGVIPANGATVSTWVDKSGLGNNATTYTGTVTYSSNALSFSQSGFQTSIVTPTNRVGSGFFVVKVTNPSGNVIFQGSCCSDGGRQFRNDSGTTLRTVKENVVDMFFSGPTVNNTLMLVGYVDDGTNLTHSVNGTLYSTTLATTFSSGRTVLIGYSQNGEYLIGNIHEVVLFNTNVTTTQRQQVESYLAQKWGLTASLPGGHSHFTKQAGAVTTVALSKFKVTGLPRITFASTGLVITHQDGRTWKATANNPGYANYAIGLNSGTSMSLNIYAGADVFNSAGGRVALLYNGDTNNAVRHAGYVMWTSTFAANNYDFGWKFVSSGSGYLIYNDYPSIGSAWQVTYDPGQDRVLIQPPGAGTYGMVWNITPRVTLAYVYSSY